MEPSTPPSRRSGFPHTPATPRLGLWEDNDHELLQKRALQTPVRAPKSPQQPFLGMHTPRITPRRRVLFPPTTPVRGSGRQGKRLAAPRPRKERIEAVELVGGVQAETTQPARQPAVFTATKTEFPAEKDGKKGMWYVFRGKRVFRPYAGKIPTLEPIKLFTDDLQPTTLFGVPQATAHDSEEDTDIE